MPILAHSCKSTEILKLPQTLYSYHGWYARVVITITSAYENECNQTILLCCFVLFVKTWDLKPNEYFVSVLLRKLLRKDVSLTESLFSFSKSEILNGFFSLAYCNYHITCVKLFKKIINRAK